MKKKIAFMMMAVMSLFAAATNRFYIEDFTIAPGENRTLSILLDNEVPYTAFQCDLYLPDGLSVEEEDGDYIFDHTTRKGRDHNIASQVQADGAIRVMSYSPTIKAYSGNSGALVTFNVIASVDLEGPATIQLKNILFTTTAGAEVAFADEICNVTVPNTNLKGDVDVDGSVNIADVSTLIDYLLGTDVVPFNVNNADVDGSNDISIADVTTMIDYLLSGSWPSEPEEPTQPLTETFTVNGVSFTMVEIEGGTFMMGATPEQGDEARDNEKPVHKVTLSSFNIGQTEVTQELWLAVMGNNPSHFVGDLQRPVEKVSWVDCQEFIAELNRLTGRTFRLPTEAEWEYAARGGNKSQGYRYAGSNDMDAVSWHSANCNNMTHPVGTKASNELGLYDMTGNVWEWCNDWYSRYTADDQTNPTGPETGNNRVLRGGCWNGGDNYNRISFRDNFTPTGNNSSGGLRLVLDVDHPDVYTVNGISFTMIPVKGGTFTMGTTEEEDSDHTVFVASPPHLVTLSDYSIGQIEVTCELWYAVMGSSPSNNDDLQCPMYNVNWNECQTFINQLNELTGMNFRLPTEAEWEFAAQGGTKSKGYVYAGSNNLDDVAWYNENSNGTFHPVATKKPNELGLYDMNGNIEEWINDWYSLYTADPVTNPTGPETGMSRVHRGGRWNASYKVCRITRRDGFSPGVKRNYMGLRLAL